MIHLELPVLLVAVLAGAGVFGILARRNAVLVLIGVELVLNSANLLLVTAGSRSGSPLAAGAVLTLFVITIAAAEVVVALAIVLVLFRTAGHVDLTRVPVLDDGPDPDDLDDAEQPHDAVASGGPDASGEPDASGAPGPSAEGDVPAEPAPAGPEVRA
ncbi:NADH-quinone oxidoreductase subunit NuoK [Intrasporangium sp. YIM S08009]|uniref:NADH-quinone oxidoreductase subunit NuoK n=1 Tax=Intrasporangium zincisolvens TaxID=3080018 RepID=UPI002B061223|nr:NADH-quinone oxidoreductase subunit NuoK [Intrasporangium sp. YIM S08009]